MPLATLLLMHARVHEGVSPSLFKTRQREFYTHLASADSAANAKAATV